MIRNNRRSALACAAILLLAGCSSVPPVAAPVDPEKARAALRTTLDAWKAGKPIESLTSEGLPIVAQDFDWMQGKKLASYEVLGDGTPMDANLRVEVKLAFDDGGDKKVAYIVGTSPKVTVFRAFE
jgi:hypothetical protein